MRTRRSSCCRAIARQSVINFAFVIKELCEIFTSTYTTNYTTPLLHFEHGQLEAGKSGM